MEECELGRGDLVPGPPTLVELQLKMRYVVGVAVAVQAADERIVGIHLKVVAVQARFGKPVEAVPVRYRNRLRWR